MQSTVFICKTVVSLGWDKSFINKHSSQYNETEALHASTIVPQTLKLIKK